MGRYIFKRFLQTIPTLIGITLVTFLLLFIIPGDPAINMAGQRADEATIQKIRKDLGLTQPLYSQYLLYIKRLIKLDLGTSYFTNIKVKQALFDTFPRTFLLASFAMGIAVIFGISLGIVTAVKKNTLWDHLGMVFALLGISTPVFWFGLILILIFAWHFKIFPPVGYGSIQNLVLPAFTLGLRSTAYIARFTRTNMLDILTQNYIKTARAKGLSEYIVIIKHGFRNSLIPVITLIGLDFGSYLNGSVITETIFGYPGFGRLMMDAIMQRDIPLVMGGILFGAFVFVCVNLTVDILYVYLNPKVRL